MIYVICGPTGSGKTDIAHQLSKRLNCPIINADAFQIYQEMNIGTAKISKDDPFYKNYYLLDIVTPEEQYSVKRYQDDCREVLDELLHSNKDIIICGGTGLYIRATLYDYHFNEENEFDDSKFQELDDETLWNKLKEIDPESASKIHMNNRKRVIRALAIYENQNISKSEQINQQEHKLIYKDVKLLFLNPPRELVYENINKRVDTMIKQGLEKEVRYLLDKYQLSITAKEAIGYKEMIEYIDGKLSFEDAVNLIKQRTRNYAKRQVTFFKHQFECEEYSSKEELLKAVK